MALKWLGLNSITVLLDVSAGFLLFGAGGTFYIHIP
jgi:hypothetical protein